MKKILLASSALAVAFATSAHADTPKITVGGSTDWQVGIMSDDADANQRSHAFYNDTEIDFNIDGKADNGLGYGAVIVIEADVTNDAQGEGTNAARTFIYLDGSWGRVELGSNYAPSKTMKVDAAKIARATGGIDGKWYRYANNPGQTTYISSPDLPLGYGVLNLSGATSAFYGDETQENVNKIVYYTPVWNGFQAGISYSPNDSDRGQGIARADNRPGVALPDGFFTLGRVENVWSGALSYDAKYDNGLGVALAGTFERGDSEITGAAGFEDLFAWNVGGKLSYEGFAVAGSYGDWDDSLGATGNRNDQNSYWTAGAAYEHGPYGISVTYLNSTVERGTGNGENEFDNLVFSADYQLAPGLTPYAELSLYDADAAVNANDNDGHVFLLGTQLNF